MIALCYCIRCFRIKFWCWGLSVGTLPYYLYFDAICASIILWLVWCTYGWCVMFFTCNYHGLVGVTLCNMIDHGLVGILPEVLCLFEYLIMWIMTISIYMWSHICVRLLIKLDYYLVCIVIGLSLDYSYITKWVYDGHISVYIIVYRMTWGW